MRATTAAPLVTDILSQLFRDGQKESTSISLLHDEGSDDSTHQFLTLQELYTLVSPAEKVSKHVPFHQLCRDQLLPGLLSAEKMGSS